MIKALELQWTQTFEKRGEGACEEYRIPGLVITDRGTLVICYEGRMAARDDWAVIHLTICRSTDDGQTWHKQVIELPAELGGSTADTLNNPTLIADGNRLHLIFHWHYERAFHCFSDDDGITWGRPAEITEAFREAPYDWNVCATGPGHGIRMKNGTLVAPIWLANGRQVDEYRRAHHPSVSGAIYSEDGGETWHMGGLMTDVIDANETNVTELADGRLLFNVRNCEEDHHRRLAWSSDCGRSMTSLVKAEDLEDPWCFGSMATLGDGTLLFSNCSTTGLGEVSGRINQSIKQSSDCGMTWKKVIQVDDIGGYSDIAVAGSYLYILYERTINGCIDALMLKKYKMETD